VGDPIAYRWSSCAARLSSNPPAWLDPDPCYLAMGRTDEERQMAYLAFLNEGNSDAQLRLIRDAVRRGQLTGDPDFAGDIASRTGRTIERRGPGRPPKRPKK
jgi:putative transposase